jgi:hypothetical protein
MEAKINCNVFRCQEECTEHAYCDSCFDEKLKEAYDDGYETAKKEYQTL